MRIVGIIPARGNSKRVERKNLQELGGKPLIAWTIEAARASMIHNVIVSTEDTEIKLKALSYGAEVMPRPSRLAHDAIHSVDVIMSVLTLMPRKPDLVCMLLPTSPFRTAKHIDEALQLYGTPYKGQTAPFDWCDAVVSVNTAPFPLIRLRETAMDGSIRPVRLDLTPRGLTTNSQFCSPLYVVNGALFIASYEHLEEHRTFHAGKVLPYYMHGDDGLDIDTPEDLTRARQVCQDRALV